MRKIMIDPGHGGRFTGANGIYVTGAGRRVPVEEKTLALKASSILKVMLEQSGYEVMMSRDDDRDFGPEVTEDLMVRCEMEKIFKPDFFVSIHCNHFSDPEVEGFEVWTYPGQNEADELADKIYEKVGCSGILSKMRSDESDGDHDKEEEFYVLKHTSSPAVLLELGFISNQGDLEILMSHTLLTDLMAAIKAGIDLQYDERGKA